MTQSKYWNPITETMPRWQLEKLQLRKLKRLLRFAYEHSPLWQRKLRAANLRPEDIQTLEDIENIPFLTRQELMEAQAGPPPFGDAVAHGPERVVRYHQTSGSSGRMPLRIVDTWRDWEWVSEMWCYGMWAFGVRETDVVYLAYNYGNFIGFWGAHYAAEKIGAMTIPGGGMSSEERIRRLLELGATVLVCTPTYARRLATVAQEMGIDLVRDSKIRLLIHAGEPGAQVPATKKMLQELWGAKVGDFPGMSETGGSTSYECAEQCGGNHILEDHYIQEVIEPGGTKRLGYGEIGELVITSFGREAIPLIRYRTGDLVRRVESSYCSCGRTFDLYLGGILGRADDMKVVRGVNIFPTTVENIVRGFPEVGEYELVIYEKDGDDRVELRVEASSSLGREDYGRLASAIAQELYAAHSMKFDVEVLPPGSLPQFELKAKRLRDLRGQGARRATG